LEDYITRFFLGACWRTVTGAPVAGNFGLRGQETVRNPRAREPDRLFLAGWEVSQFWAEPQAELENINNISWRYVFSLLCCVMWSIIMLSNMMNMLNMWFIIMLLINLISVEYGIWFIIMLLINLIYVEYGYILNNEWLYVE
jgi:hypothetical protein